MSLRLYARIGNKQYQVLGNNEFPKCLKDELTRQGADINEDGCFGKICDNEYNIQYTFKVKDLNGIIKALEQYIKETNDNYQKRKSAYQKNSDKAYTAMTIADFSDDIFLQPRTNFMTEAIKEIMELGYIFCSANLLNFIGRENYTVDFGKVYWRYEIEYKLKDNVDLYMYAY